MRAAWRMLLLASLVLLLAMAWRATAYDLRFLDGTHAFRADRYREALERFLQARAVNDSDSGVWAWIGDAASADYLNPPAGGWDAAHKEDLLTTAWGGYAGAVLRCPLDTWSRSGLAEVALLRAERQDAEHGVDLAEIDRRSRGTLDPWRGVALVAAKMAVELKPSGYQELDILTKVYASAAQLDAARESVVRSARMMPAPSFHSWGEGESLAKPLYDAILAASREGLERTPRFERSGLHLDIARFAVGRSDFDAALVEMRQAEAAAGDPNERYLALRGTAEVLEAMGRLEDAIRAWDAVLGSGKAVTADRRQRGVVLYRVNRKADACRDLRDSVRDLPEDARLRAFAAVACEEGGDVEVAERLLREGFVLPGDNPALARGLLDFYVRTGRRNTAEGLVRSWTRDFPDREEFRHWADELGASKP